MKIYDQAIHWLRMSMLREGVSIGAAINYRRNACLAYDMATAALGTQYRPSINVFTYDMKTNKALRPVSARNRHKTLILEVFTYCHCEPIGEINGLPRFVGRQEDFHFACYLMMSYDMVPGRMIREVKPLTVRGEMYNNMVLDGISDLNRYDNHRREKEEFVQASACLKSARRAWIKAEEARQATDSLQLGNTEMDW